MVVSQHAVSLIFLGHTAVSEANYVTLHKVFKRPLNALRQGWPLAVQVHIANISAG